MSLTERLAACYSAGGTGAALLAEATAGLPHDAALLQPLLQCAARCCTASHPPDRLLAYASLRPFLAALTTRPALDTALHTLTPHLLLARYYGGVEMQRWHAQDTWRQLVCRLEEGALPPPSAAPAPSSPLQRAVQVGMALAAPAQQHQQPASPLPALSPSAAAALAPGAEGVSVSGPALVAQHVEGVAAFLVARLQAAAASLRSEGAALAAQGHSLLAPPCAAALPLLSVALEAEALCHTLAELATKIPSSAVAPHALGLAQACAPLALAGLQSPAAAAPAAAAAAQRPPPWLPRGATAFSLLAAVRLGALVAQGKLLANFADCRATPGQLRGALGVWLGELAVQPDGQPQPPRSLPALAAAVAAAPSISLRQQRSHCAMVSGLLLACAPMEHTAGLAAGLCAVARRRLSGESIGEAGVLEALGDGVGAAAAAARRASGDEGAAGDAAAGDAAAGEAAAGEAAAGNATGDAAAAAATSTFDMEGGLFLLRELSASFPEEAVELLPVACSLAAQLLARARQQQQQQPVAPPAQLQEAEARDLVLLECLWRAMVDVVKGLGKARVKRHIDALLAPMGACAALQGGGPMGGGARGHLLFSAARAALDCAQVLQVCVGRQVFVAHVEGREHGQCLLAVMGGE